MILRRALIKYNLSLTVKTLLDVKRTKSLKNIGVFQSLTGKARDSDRFNVCLFSFLSAFQEKVAMSDVADALQICLILA